MTIPTHQADRELGRPHSLARRLTRAALQSTALALLVAGMAVNVLVYGWSSATLRGQAELQAAIAADGIAPAVLFGDVKAAGETLRLLKASSDIRRAIVLDVTADAQAFAAYGLVPDSADCVLMNPPFNDPARHRGSPDQARHTAHVATGETLHAWVHAARRILRSNGVLTLIWRADGIADVLAALSRGFGSVSVLPVHGEAGRPAIRVLVRAIKGGRAPLRLLPGLMLNDEARVPKKEVRNILEGRAVLPLAEP